MFTNQFCKDSAMELIFLARICSCCEKYFLVLLYWLSFCKVLEVFRRLESWASSDFQGSPGTWNSPWWSFLCTSSHQTNSLLLLPSGNRALQLQNGVSQEELSAGLLGGGEAKVSLHPLGWACLRVLSWPQCAARVQGRLFRAGQCTFWATHPLHRGHCAHSNPWSITMG